MPFPDREDLKTVILYNINLTSVLHAAALSSGYEAFDIFSRELSEKKLLSFSEFRRENILLKKL